ncbi:PhoU domain protein [mine drainage metagenome]|uniref:PhoU domain protein n=1 Tax=mine drainage metagenome TaxID=410659 RepID=T1CCB0_9ZZZZ
MGDRLRLRALADRPPVRLDRSLARMGRLVVDLHREAVASWPRLPLDEDGYWDRRDDAVDREAWYLQRSVALRLSGDRPDPDLLGAWTVARSLERIADHAVVLGTVGPRLVELPTGAGPSVSLGQFHTLAMEHLEGVLNATDAEAANGLLDTGAALIESGRSLADRLLPGVGGASMPPATAAALARVFESIGRTIAYGQDIAQVVLDRPAPQTHPDATAGDRPVRARPAGPERTAGARERFLASVVT